MACTQHNKFLILQACRHACTHKIDDIETLVQRTRVRTRGVHQTRVHQTRVHQTRVHQTRVHIRCVHAKAGLHTPWRIHES